MGWLAKRGKNRPGTLRTADSADRDHLREFVETRSGVEAYFEPRTTVTDATVVLVAATGEWTRRRIGSLGEAQSFTKKLAVPLYDAAKVGYPQRMREWTRQRKAGDNRLPEGG